VRPLLSARFLAALFAALMAATGLAPGTASVTTAPAHGVHAKSASPVPQVVRHRGEAGYAVQSAAALKAGRSSKGRRAIFRGGLRAPSTSTGTATATPSTRTALVPAPRPGLFTALTKPGMDAAGNPFQATPPDSTGAIGPNNYVEMDNSNIAVYDRNLNLSSSVSLNAFSGSSLDFCDVQVEWDAAAGRYLFAFLMCDFTQPMQFQVFGWSKTSDPTNLSTGPLGGWCLFAFNNSHYLFDYDKLGHSSQFMVIGGNFYNTSFPSLPFVSAGMEWAKLPGNGDTSCTLPAVAGVTPLSPSLKNGDGTVAFTPVPVNTTSNASDVWIVAAADPAGNVPPGTPRNLVAAWDLDSAGTLHARADIPVALYDTPTPAQQLGGTPTTYLLDTLDARLTQAVGNPNDGIYTQHTVKDSAGRSEVEWYEFKQSGANLVLIQQGVIDTASSWTFNAAISPRYDGLGAAIFYNVSSATTHPSIQAQIRTSTTPDDTFLPGVLTLATSPAAVKETLSCNVSGFPCRWGDYSGASPDPVNHAVVWGTNMFNTAATTVPAWSDENFAVGITQSPPAPSPPARPSVNPAPSATPPARP